MVAPAFTAWVPPAKARVPAPVTEPARVEPVPLSVRVSPVVTAMLVPDASAKDPESPTLAFTLTAAPLERLTWAADRAAPVFNASVPPEKARVPTPVTAPAKVEAPVRVRVSPVAMERAVPAPSCLLYTSPSPRDRQKS